METQVQQKFIQPNKEAASWKHVRLHPQSSRIVTNYMKSISNLTHSAQGKTLSSGAQLKPIEAQYQDEFYQCFNKIAGRGVPVCTEWSRTTEGRVDFWIPGQKWAVEIAREQDRINEHIMRFHENGQYYPWRVDGMIQDLIIVNCTTSLPTRGYEETRLIHAVFKKDYADLQILDNQMEILQTSFRRRPKTPQPVLTKRPRANQFCVYNIPNELSEYTHRVAAYIKEYKSPHKVKIGLIYEGLDDMDIEEIMIQTDDETPKVRFQRALVGLLSQPFDYMVRAHTQVGVFSTGEDPSVLFYHLSVPKGDVGDETGWDPYSNYPNRLHLTAVGQSLAFTLQALKLQQRSQTCGLQAMNTLPKWEIILADALGEISNKEVPSSEYRPPRSEGFIRSPIQLRRKRHGPTPRDCRPSQWHCDPEDEEENPNTPSRSQRPSRSRRTKPESARLSPPTSSQSSFRKENQRRYYTLRCLHGMVKGRGEDLDQACPNVRDHGTTRHTIDSKTFLSRLKRQLSQTINANCEILDIHDSRGALLKVTLSSLGYTVPAKCTELKFRDHLHHEAAIYDKLRSIQGQYIPFYLRSIDLDHPYSYDGIAYPEYMMLLSPGGQPTDISLRAIGCDRLISKLKESLSAIHALNFVHKDPAPRNWSYNPEIKTVVIFDF
ncbi:uncharacterized protein KD926_008944 [Aspergillus affinis]|uniref:uncharacterized protein n=1 Tax=Aspergillus affinis TaxID=1070780 RepID=UPI0022FF43A8|nr:uncharacterized protein KD926_008944 [Aspergillus affinis]KAI9039958.1 hypothetical protein KD926_008944 [Aspergillus affinis]